MITEFVNGYNITGNHATVGREYHICDAAGKLLLQLPGKVMAIASAKALPPGDVPEPEETVSLPAPGTAYEAAPATELDPEPEIVPMTEAEPEPDPEP